MPGVPRDGDYSALVTPTPGPLGLGSPGLQRQRAEKAAYLSSLTPSPDPSINAARAGQVAGLRFALMPSLPAQEANARANSLTGGIVNRMGSETNLFDSAAGVNDANAADIQYQIPHVAALTDSYGGLNNALAARNNADANQINTMLPLQATQLQQQNALDLKMQPYQVGTAAQGLRGATLNNDILGIRKGNEDARQKADIAATMAGTASMPALQKENERYRRENARLLQQLASRAGTGGGGKTLDVNGARLYLQRAGGDKELAKSMAKADGYQWE